MGTQATGGWFGEDIGTIMAPCKRIKPARNQYDLLLKTGKTPATL